MWSIVFCFGRVLFGVRVFFLMYMRLYVYVRKCNVEELHLLLGAEGGEVCIGP